MYFRNLILIRDEEDDYQAQGNVYNDPSFPDGTLIITGNINKIDFEQKLIEAQGRVYGFTKIIGIIEKD